MPAYIVGQTKAQASSQGAGTALFNLWTATRRVRVTEIGLSIAVAPNAAPQLALARSSARGTQSTTVTPIAVDSSDIAATAVLDSAWSVAPTFTATAPWLNTFTLPLTAGSGLIWTFADPLEIAIGAGLCVFNVAAGGTTGGTLTAYLKYQE